MIGQKKFDLARPLPLTPCHGNEKVPCIWTKSREQNLVTMGGQISSPWGARAYGKVVSTPHIKLNVGFEEIHPPRYSSWLVWFYLQLFAMSSELTSPKPYYQPTRSWQARICVSRRTRISVKIERRLKSFESEIEVFEKIHLKKKSYKYNRPSSKSIMSFKNQSRVSRGPLVALTGLNYCENTTQLQKKF